jgi:integrase
MATENLTDSFLRSQRSQRWAERMGGKPQIDVWDSGGRGLVMRVTEGIDDKQRAKFTLTWNLVYTFRGSKRRLKLGRWPQLSHEAARRQADKALGKIADGIDPVEERRAQREHRREIENVVTVQDAAIRFLNEYRTKKREKWRESTEHTNRLMMASEVLPVLGCWPITLVTSGQVKSLLKNIVERKTKAVVNRKTGAVVNRETTGSRGNAVRANRVQALISGMFRWAMKQGLVAMNPVSGIDRLGAEQPRERKLSHAEIKTLWQVLGDGDGDVADQYRFMLITGQRVGECARLEWQELDLDSEWWTIPSDKSKNHLAHRVYLGSLAMEILKRRGPQRSGPVFPHCAGDKSIPSWRQKKIVTACGFVLPWQPRDIRRTVGSAISSKFDRSIMAQVLNHTDPTAPRVSGVYDRSDQDPKKQKAVEWWNERLSAIVTSTAVQLRPAVSAA